MNRQSAAATDSSKLFAESDDDSDSIQSCCSPITLDDSDSDDGGLMPVGRPSAPQIDDPRENFNSEVNPMPVGRPSAPQIADPREDARVMLERMANNLKRKARETREDLEKANKRVKRLRKKLGKAMHHEEDLRRGLIETKEDVVALKRARQLVDDSDECV
jgi:hypothetical protein